MKAELIDYPGFNLRLAKYAKSKLGVKILYYISPQIWAWKANRIHLIKKYVDHMAVILPFEKAIYTAAGVPCSFVGHPILETLIQIDKLSARQTLNLPSTAKVVAILPGSRTNELKYHLPVLIKTVKILLKSLPQLKFVIPVARTINQQELVTLLAKQNLPIQCITDQAQLAICASDAVVVASGTASLECALLARPMCIIYKTSYISALVVKFFMKVKYLGLCNLIANKQVVPELLQHKCRPKAIASIIKLYLTNPDISADITKSLLTVKESLTSTAAERQLEHIVEQMLLSSQDL